jgi:Tannase-like family of unknown function (DUF6351)
VPGTAGAKAQAEAVTAPLSIESSRPKMVSGGNALIAVDVPAADPIGKVRVRRNGLDVTSAFQQESFVSRRGCLRETGCVM